MDVSRKGNPVTLGRRNSAEVEAEATKRPICLWICPLASGGGLLSDLNLMRPRWLRSVEEWCPLMLCSSSLRHGNEAGTLLGVTKRQPCQDSGRHYWLLPGVYLGRWMKLDQILTAEC